MVQLVAIVVLSRLLSPAQFGIVAPLAALVGILGIVAEGGMGAALVNARKDAQAVFATALTLSLISASALAAIVWWGAPFLTGPAISEEPEVMLRWLSLSIFLQPLVALMQSHQSREFQFRRIALVDAVAATVGVALIPIILAWNGFGAWSLIVGLLTRQTIKVLLYLLLVREVPLPRFQTHIAGEMFRFSGFFLLSRISAAVMTQGERVFMADALSPAAIGYYARAQNIVQLALETGTSSFDKVLFPLFARADDDQTLRKWYCIAIAFAGLLMAPASISVAVSSSFVVNIALGSGWEEAATVLRILAPLILLRALDHCAAALLRRQSWVRLRAATQSIMAILFCLSVLLSSVHGIVAVSIVVLVVNFIAVCVNQIIILRLLGVDMRGFLGSLYPAAISSLIFCAVLFPSFCIWPNIFADVRVVLVFFVYVAILILAALLFPSLIFGSFSEIYVRLRRRVLNEIKRTKRLGQ